MKYLVSIVIILFLGCGKKDKQVEPEPTLPVPVEDIFGADLSSLPMIEDKGIIYYNRNGEPEDVLTTLKSSGIDIIRLKLWHSPDELYNGFKKVKEFSERIKEQGLKVWLTVHYSDTWADPGKQITPEAWKGLDYNILKDSIRDYTNRIIRSMKPDIIQIGNEINAGILFPEGKISTNKDQFIEILNTATVAVRSADTTTRIMIHYAGTNGADGFFNMIKNVDYDLIGISYYPAWHGKDIVGMKNILNNLRSDYGKNVLIAETAYPFTLEWNDWTNNIIGMEEHLILPDYPATPDGQSLFIAKMVDIVKTSNSITGLCYWGGELVAFDGPESVEGSPWENNALYDFNNKALKVVDEFNK